MNFTGNWIYVVLEVMERQESLKTIVCEKKAKPKNPTSTSHILITFVNKGYPHTPKIT